MPPHWRLFILDMCSHYSPQTEGTHFVHELKLPRGHTSEIHHMATLQSAAIRLDQVPQGGHELKLPRGHTSEIHHMTTLQSAAIRLDQVPQGGQK